MSHEGEQHLATPGLVTYATDPAAGGPAEPSSTAGEAGELLAERYRLEQHIDTDAAGRQIWRGTDTVLRRPVALVILHPGGERAESMLAVAKAMGRLAHPHIVSVYDAIDDGDRAYIIREWVPGVALRDVLRHASLDPEKAMLVAHAIAEAVAALHAAGIAHGNIHPGTVLVADDGRVVLADAPADRPADTVSDIRAIGAILYACLTSLWPYAEAGHGTLPDAVRDSAGRLATPRQVRGGIPRHLDQTVATLLDRRHTPPAAATLASEFARLINESDQAADAAYDDPEAYGTDGYPADAYGPDGYPADGYEQPTYEADGYEQDYGEGPMGFAGEQGRRRTGGKVALGVAVLTALIVAGFIVGAKVLSGSAAPTQSPSVPLTIKPSSGVPIPVKPSQVRVVDPPEGDRTELGGVELVVDGDESTGWSTDTYYARPDFGGLKPGMGILIDLGETTAVGAVKIVVNASGASAELRTGPSDPGNTSAGDDTIAREFTTVGKPLEKAPGTVIVLSVPEEQQDLRYVLVWFSQLPRSGDGYKITVQEITLLTP